MDRPSEYARISFALKEFFCIEEGCVDCHLRCLLSDRAASNSTNWSSLQALDELLTSRIEKQISSVIKSLTEGSPADQKNALDTYFLPDSSFIHPLCRVPSFKNYTLPLIGDINSRWVIWMIYRWYKILSPRIVLDVECDGMPSPFNPIPLSTHC
jgi:hypothetical protein